MANRMPVLDSGLNECYNINWNLLLTELHEVGIAINKITHLLQCLTSCSYVIIVIMVSLIVTPLSLDMQFVWKGNEATGYHCVVRNLNDDFFLPRPRVHTSERLLD